jgi:hypothetical protein
LQTFQKKFTNIIMFGKLSMFKTHLCAMTQSKQKFYTIAI